MKIGKYVTNLGVLGSLASVYGVIKQTKEMPTDWRRFAVWGVWLLTVVLAVAAVAKREEDLRHEDLR